MAEPTRNPHYMLIILESSCSVDKVWPQKFKEEFCPQSWTAERWIAEHCFRKEPEEEFVSCPVYAQEFNETPGHHECCHASHLYRNRL